MYVYLYDKGVEVLRLCTSVNLLALLVHANKYCSVLRLPYQVLAHLSIYLLY